MPVERIQRSAGEQALVYNLISYILPNVAPGPYPTSSSSNSTEWNIPIGFLGYKGSNSGTSFMTGV